MNSSLGSFRFGRVTLFAGAVLLAVCSSLGMPGVANSTTRPELITQEAGIKQNLNIQVDLSLPFTGPGGETAPLTAFVLPNRPTLIVPVYFDCPRLCSVTLKGVSKVLNELELELGTDYKLLAVSFDPKETPAEAKQKAEENYAYLTHPERGPKGWEFLVGTPEPIGKLMTQLGFQYAADGEEFSHSAAMMLLTPEGRISRYFMGVDFDVRDLRYSMIEASQGKIGGIVDHIFLYCFRFDPTKGKYTLVIMNFTKVVSALGVTALVTLLVMLKIREGETGR